ncbi:MAG: hypoxanthine phosphoribosyltransferase [Spirochaeta sp. LUC14_002_19_P3]|nr:MAG: hypoxanthine phosphoribosyltransferase [Spirochaeta sp. LUC14_002_19_P3]
MKYHVEELISADTVRKRVGELAREIEAAYKGKEDIVLVGLLRGSVVFMADLARLINLEVKMDFMVVSSYGNNTESSRDVRIDKDLTDDIRGLNVIIVEDIIDTGYTLATVREMLQLREPASMKICTLLDKPERRETTVPVDYIGFQIPDVFVIGYGIDYAQKHRNLPYIGKVVPEGK